MQFPLGEVEILGLDKNIIKSRVNNMKEIIKNVIEDMKHQLWSISDYIYNNPELGDEEYKASKRLIDFLEENDFNIERNILGRATAFKASYKADKEGPCVAFLCEYDALPQIGHGCGHNMIGTMSAGAGVALKRVIDIIGGQILVIGTPAEETNGAKVAMADNGEFDGVDAVLILHPANENYQSGNSLAMDAIQFLFKGRTAHAASEPEAGINALDSAILTFNGINALRQHVKSDVRMHGIIKEGGQAANIVPDRAIAQFYVRANERAYLDEVVEKVKNIARGAALMTGAEVEISNYELSYDNMITNKALSRAFTDNLKLTGINDIRPSSKDYGSIDMGNVSHVVPAIHPYISIGSTDIIGHTKQMADATITQQAHQAMLKGIEALAFTGYDIITDSRLLQEIKAEFKTSLSE